jgi:hypothetical protein
MKAIRFEQMQFDLGAGNNPNTIDLPVAVTTEPGTREDGAGMLVSCWEPSPEELAEINRTGRVWLGVMCSPHSPTQPPVYLSGHDLYIAHGYENVSQHNKEEREKRFAEAAERVIKNTPDKINKGNERIIRIVVDSGVSPYESAILKDNGITKEEIDSVMDVMREEMLKKHNDDNDEGRPTGRDFGE